MTTLFVTATWPDPLARFTHGVAQRMRLLLRGAQQADPLLDLLAFAPWNQAPDPGAAERIRADLAAQWGVVLRQVHVAPSDAVPDRLDSLLHGYLLPMTSLQRQPSYARLSGSRQAQALAAALAASRPDRLFVHKLTAMCPLLALAPAARPAVPVVMDLDDIEHKAFERLIALPPHWRAKRLMRGWLPALRRGERRALGLARTALVCSEADRADLSTRFGLSNLAVVPNAVADVEPSPLPATPTALFLGMHSYEPNRVAAEFLVHQIWPRVLQQHPGASLVVAGKGCELIRGHGQDLPGVRFEGFVADLAALYARSRVVCCPILSGGGTRIKIIEGAMQARPIVSTTLGAEGLDLSPARGEIALADGAESFAAALARLLADDTAAQAMGQAARAQALALYSERTVLARVAALLQEAES
jgi:glycosyltransferase involved in cell wall biosynthesis